MRLFTLFSVAFSPVVIGQLFLWKKQPVLEWVGVPLNMLIFRHKYVVICIAMGVCNKLHFFWRYPLYFLGICAILISVSVGALVLVSGFIIIIEMFFVSNN